MSDRPRQVGISSTGSLLTFTAANLEHDLLVQFDEDTIWLTQSLMGELFDVDKRTVSEHLGNILSSGELEEEAVVRKFRTTASDGKNYQVNHYNLDAIISVGYRVNSKRATQFRMWATKVLRDFTLCGYVVDRQGMEQWAGLLDQALVIDGRNLLTHAGNISKKLADQFALDEYSKFRVEQDKYFKSDFDAFVEEGGHVIESAKEDHDE